MKAKSRMSSEAETLLKALEGADHLLCCTYGEDCDFFGILPSGDSQGDYDPIRTTRAVVVELCGLGHLKSRGPESGTLAGTTEQTWILTPQGQGWLAKRHPKR